MKENLRKPLLFVIIVVIGSVLVLFDIPLLLLLPLILVVGFGTLVALGSISISEIRGAIADLGKSGVLKRLNDIKVFEKKAATVSKPVSPPVPAKPDLKKSAIKPGEEKPGLVSHIRTFVSSLGSLGTILKQTGKSPKKVEDINKLLDKTVSEKVTVSPRVPAAPQTSGGGAGAAAAPAAADDPFMTLSADEFDEGLLDGLGDDGNTPVSPVAPAEATPELPLSMPDLTEGADDLPAPGLDLDSAAGDILRQASAESGESAEDEFAGLDAGGLSDADFGDLDGLSLDGVDGEPDEGTGAEKAMPTPAPEEPAQQAAAAPPQAGGAVKTAWIPSDAPTETGTELQDDVSTQADMASFASGAGGDEDLLSSLAADVKHTKKEKDVSLLRELKDFKAPATEIEQELTGMFDRMKQAQQTKRKDRPAPKEIK